MATDIAAPKLTTMADLKGKVDPDWCPGCGDFGVLAAEMCIRDSSKGPSRGFLSNKSWSLRNWLDHNFVHGNGKGGSPLQLLFHCFHDVVRHKGFTVVFADVPISHKAGFAAQVAGKLATVVVLDNDGVAGTFQDIGNGVAVQRYQPTNLQLVGGDSLLCLLYTSRCV